MLSEKKFTLQQVTTNEGSLITGNTTATATIFPISQVNGLATSNVNIGHNQRVKMTLPWDKMCAFDWMKNSLPTVRAEAPGAYVQQLGNVQGCVRPKDRVYMTVRALNPTTTTLFSGPGGSIGITPGNTPSFDFKIRNTWCQLA